MGKKKQRGESVISFIFIIIFVYLGFIWKSELNTIFNLSKKIIIVVIWSLSKKNSK